MKLLRQKLKVEGVTVMVGVTRGREFGSERELLVLERKRRGIFRLRDQWRHQLPSPALFELHLHWPKPSLDTEWYREMREWGAFKEKKWFMVLVIN